MHVPSNVSEKSERQTSSNMGIWISMNEDGESWQKKMNSFESFCSLEIIWIFDVLSMSQESTDLYILAIF